MLYRFNPDQSIPAFSLHSKLFPFLYRCLWCRLLRGNSLLETTGSSANDLYPGGGYCFHVLHNSCIFLFRDQLYTVFFFSTTDHLFPQRDTEGTCVVVIEETFEKINTWTLVYTNVILHLQNSLMLNQLLHTADYLFNSKISFKLMCAPLRIYRAVALCRVLRIKLESTDRCCWIFSSLVCWLALEFKVVADRHH